MTQYSILRARDKSVCWGAVAVTASAQHFSPNWMLEFCQWWLCSDLRTRTHHTWSSFRCFGVEMSFSARTLLSTLCLIWNLSLKDQRQGSREKQLRVASTVLLRLRCGDTSPRVELQCGSDCGMGSQVPTTMEHQVSALRKTRTSIFSKAPLNSVGLRQHLHWFFFFTGILSAPFSLFKIYVCLFLHMCVRLSVSLSVCLWAGVLRSQRY